VLTGLPFGHIKERATLPYGGMAHLASTERGFDLTISDYLTL
jgi:muramoyltetrapeptide carboxypeptidase